MDKIVSENQEKSLIINRILNGYPLGYYEIKRLERQFEIIAELNTHEVVVNSDTEDSIAELLNTIIKIEDRLYSYTWLRVMHDPICESIHPPQILIEVKPLGCPMEGKITTYIHKY